MDDDARRILYVQTSEMIGGAAFNNMALEADRVICF